MEDDLGGSQGDDDRQHFVDYLDSPLGDRSRESSAGRDASRQEMTEERRAKLREIEVCADLKTINAFSHRPPTKKNC